MKRTILILLLLQISGCTSNIMLLQARDINVAEYNLIFGRKLIDFKQDIEPQLNEILKSNKNTVNCSVAPNSVNLGEPGSQGTASVICESAISMEKQEAYNGPIYFYEF